MQPLKSFHQISTNDAGAVVVNMPKFTIQWAGFIPVNEDTLFNECFTHKFAKKIIKHDVFTYSVCQQDI